MLDSKEMLLIKIVVWAKKVLSVAEVWSLSLCQRIATGYFLLHTNMAL